jgi:hypothetical protein
MLGRRWKDAPENAKKADFSRSPVKTRVRMLANEPESIALEATCVIVCPDQTAKNGWRHQYSQAFCHNGRLSLLIVNCRLVETTSSTQDSQHIGASVLSMDWFALWQAMIANVFKELAHLNAALTMMWKS